MKLIPASGNAGAAISKPEPSIHNTAALKLQLTQAAKPSAQAASAAIPRSAFAVAAAAGLPADSLSACIVSFARFFSLPIKPELLAGIRRQVFAQHHSVPSREAHGTAAAALTAIALAAAAAEGKGVELSPKGLELYADAINGEGQKQHNAEERNQRGRRNKNGSGYDKAQEPSQTGPISADRLKETALEFAEKNPLLAILNRLPGKNSRRWIVFPFTLCENGRELKVSLRVLLNAADNTACPMITLDIAETGKERWLFVLKTAVNPAASQQKQRAAQPFERLLVYCPAAQYSQYELPAGALANKRSNVTALSSLLKIPPECICIKKMAEMFPGEANFDENLLYLVDEAI